MTNEEAKQEAIKFLLKVGYKLIDNDHYVKISTSINLEEKAVANEKGEQIFFKSYTELFSILKEDNNSWIRIESDGSNLPLDEYKIKYYAFWKDGKIYEASGNQIVRMQKHNAITHYQLIIKPKPPIY